ncbi:peptidoglycan-binding protein [Thalassovita taeanensis]|uniref:Putative peptidoglycan binding domain-containing protein n=1 Tax=Thalassovita taeanensis TaxID=657014 RepID=A0A1H9IMX7_9RHOB|nr:peptidoglycan-binding protein [Thalassovita taeanensis]SEQ75916.1 Putative peptidoglycan binding domain-containing protein [Thalassovita taeanensis]
MTGFRNALIGGMLSVWAGALGAEDFALVLSNRNYDRAPTARDAAEAAGFVRALEAAGFTVISGENWTSGTMREAAGRVQAALENGSAERLIFVLSGHFAAGPGDGWLLGREARAISALTAGDAGLSLAAMMQMAAQRPGQAVVMLVPGGGGLPLGFGLQTGAGAPEVPQGVTLLEGDAGSLQRVLRDTILQESDRPMAALREDAPRGVTVRGFLPQDRAFLSAKQAGGAATPQVEVGEFAYWSAVRDIGSAEAIETYLTRYPSGRFAGEAQRMLAELREAPLRRAEETEAALALSRDARREIQRNLSLLGFDPRGIDGVFGRGSRAAIAAFQRAGGEQETGFLTTDQIRRLQREADRRAAELEEEARQRRVEEERRDRAYWSSTGNSEDEQGLRAYLSRYPDGLYADVARARLDAIEEQRRRTLATEMRQDWDRTRQADTVEAYQEFLRRYPRSELAESARARIDELQGEDRNRGQIEADKAEESRVANNPIARLVIEQKLATIGFDPGPVDGTFSRETRRAIRQFQRTSSLPVTGFVSQTTMVRLLAAGRGG